MDKVTMVKQGKIIKLGEILCILGLSCGLAGCATSAYQKIGDRFEQEKINQELQEKDKTLRIFDKDKQLLIMAMEHAGFKMFDSAKLLNDYLAICDKDKKEYSDEGFKQYLSDALGKNMWYIDFLWKDVNLTYNLLKKMEKK